MLLSGNYLWNAGIFLCTASTLLEALGKHAPDILSSCQQAMQNPEIDGPFVRPNKESFLSCRAESIDYAVMEHFDKVAVVPFKGAWSDVGSWNAVAALSPADDVGNRINGQGLAVHSTNTYINAPHRPVVALGTSDLVIVDTPDAVLVALDARLAEKASVFALSQELMLNLRPELDRMAAELVQRSVQGMWDKRAEVYQRIGRQSD
jgi:mannose-1-phosphate guanylyltransferase/mannose-6-phosphate isomerase